MRTTLKKGIGRGAAVNGNGHGGSASRRADAGDALPPAAAAAPRAGCPRGRTVLRLGGRGVLAVVVVGVVGGFYLWAHESVAAAAADLGRGPADPGAARPAEVRRDRARARLRPPRRRRQLPLALGHDDADPGRPGHEHDLDALVPARPAGPDLLPRQGRRADVGYGTGRINSAYAYCGLGGALETVRHLTNLPINYLIPINFLGFIGVVNKLGGVWLDVDRRYYNRNVGTSRPTTRTSTCSRATST